MAEHPNKHIREAIKYAESKGWTFERAAGGHAHVYGMLYCPRRRRDGHRVPVYCTPKNPQDHAKWLRRNVDHCTH